jgi:hypothetical protein
MHGVVGTSETSSIPVWEAGIQIWQDGRFGRRRIRNSSDERPERAD